MKTTNNTVLITGGSAGIGFEIARLLTEKGNHVIITGRNEERLHNAASKLNNVTAITSDVTSEKDVMVLTQRLEAEFPELNIVINNAGSAFLHNLATETGIFEKAAQEMLTNYLSVISLNEKLLPLLKQQDEASIVNVSSIVAFVPGALATYSASKAALHSYSQSLRLALEDTSVKVFELMPPLVNTEFSAPIGGHNGMPPSEVAQELLDAFESDEYEIHVGETAALYKVFLSSPAEALNLLNAHRKAVLQ
jgi:uncharacterized oxidoreductase